MISYVSAIHKEVKELKTEVKTLCKLVEKIVAQEQEWQEHENALVWREADDGK